MDKKVVQHRAILEGYPALVRLGRMKDANGQPMWPLRVSHPIGRNLKLLRDDYEQLQEEEQGQAVKEAQLARDHAFSDRDGKPLGTGVPGGIMLKKPTAFDAARKTLEAEWKTHQKQTVEIQLIPIKVSELQAALPKQGDETPELRLDGEDLMRLVELGVLVYDVAEEAKKP